MRYIPDKVNSLIVEAEGSFFIILPLPLPLLPLPLPPLPLLLPTPRNLSICEPLGVTPSVPCTPPDEVFRNPFVIQEHVRYLCHVTPSACHA